MRRLLAGALTVVLMGVLAWTGIRRPAADRSSGREGDGRDGLVVVSSSEATSPAEARVQALLEAIRQGDVAAYLASFDGPLRSRLERQVEERGRAAFAEDLQAAARARKSHAVFAAEPDGPDAARVTVESVYPGYNERQTFRIDRGPGGWRITESEIARSHQPKAKYGTPASYEAPEGVPVQGGGIAVETGDDAPNP